MLAVTSDPSFIIVYITFRNVAYSDLLSFQFCQSLLEQNKVAFVGCTGKASPKALLSFKVNIARLIDPGGVTVHYNEAINTWNEVKAPPEPLRAEHHSNMIC